MTRPDVVIRPIPTVVLGAVAGLMVGPDVGRRRLDRRRGPADAVPAAQGVVAGRAPTSPRRSRWSRPPRSATSCSAASRSRSRRRCSSARSRGRASAPGSRAGRRAASSGARWRPAARLEPQAARRAGPAGLGRGARGGPVRVLRLAHDPRPRQGAARSSRCRPCRVPELGRSPAWPRSGRPSATPARS